MTFRDSPTRQTAGVYSESRQAGVIDNTEQVHSNGRDFLNFHIRALGTRCSTRTMRSMGDRLVRPWLTRISGACLTLVKLATVAGAYSGTQMGLSSVRRALRISVKQDALLILTTQGTA
jgi:hypothetical protein